MKRIAWAFGIVFSSLTIAAPAARATEPGLPGVVRFDSVLADTAPRSGSASAMVGGFSSCAEYPVTGRCKLFPNLLASARAKRGFVARGKYECGPDGCPGAIGCSSFWSEYKFLFGSCRQFFGHDEAAPRHHFANLYFLDY